MMATVTPRVSMMQGIRLDGKGDLLGAMRATAGHDGNGDPPGTWVEDEGPRPMAKLLDSRRPTLVCVLSSLGSPSVSCKDS